MTSRLHRDTADQIAAVPSSDSRSERELMANEPSTECPLRDHIKGWRLSAGDEHTVFDGSNARLVSVPCGGMTGRTFKEAADCARLIAAAPEMLRVLRSLIDGSADIDTVYEDAREVVFKAIPA